jgi:hypothetical protein
MKQDKKGSGGGPVITPVDRQARDSLVLEVLKASDDFPKITEKALSFCTHNFVLDREAAAYTYQVMRVLSALLIDIAPANPAGWRGQAISALALGNTEEALRTIAHFQSSFADISSCFILDIVLHRYDMSTSNEQKMASARAQLIAVKDDRSADTTIRRLASHLLADLGDAPVVEVSKESAPAPSLP